MNDKEVIIEFEDLKVQTASTQLSGGEMLLDASGIELGELIEAIGEKTIKEYLGILEDEE